MLSLDAVDLVGSVVAGLVGAHAGALMLTLDAVDLFGVVAADLVVAPAGPLHLYN